MRIKRLDKLPKRKVTITDLLNLDDIQTVINDLEADKDRIAEVITIWANRDEDMFHFATNGLRESRIIYALESVKNAILNSAGEE
jgi:ribosomal protein L2